jgi:hypothetical protein
MSDENQERLAKLLTRALNEGVLQDAVAAGLEEQGPFTMDVLSVLDALASAGLKLVRDDHIDDQRDVTIADTTLLGIEGEFDDGEASAGK